MFVADDGGRVYTMLSLTKERVSGAVLVNESYIRRRASNTHLAEEKLGIFLEAAMCMSASSAFARWRQSPLGATVSSIHLVACE